MAKSTGTFYHNEFRLPRMFGKARTLNYCLKVLKSSLQLKNIEANEKKCNTHVTHVPPDDSVMSGM